MLFDVAGAADHVLTSSVTLHILFFRNKRLQLERALGCGHIFDARMKEFETWRRLVTSMCD
jgi:hypothetical protein